jgi:HEAT repeat protein
MPVADAVLGVVAFVVWIALVARGILSERTESFVASERSRDWAPELAEAARQVGLVETERGVDSVDARAPGLHIRISRYVEQETAGTRVQLWGPGLGPGLTLRREGDSFLGRRDPKEIEIGDSAFDRAVAIQGSPALALALLDPDMRRAVAGLVQGRLELRGHRPLWISGRLAAGVLRVDLPDRVPHLRLPAGSGGDLAQAGAVYLDGPSTLPAVLRAAVEVARRLSSPENLAQRLAANFKTEPEAGVRRKLVATLLREFPEAEVTTATLRGGLQDPDADVRVRAATLLGKEGHEVLLGVARGEGAEDATTARAVAALGDSLSLAEVRELLRNALRTRRFLAAKACLEALGRLGGPDAVQALGKVLLVEGDELGATAATALAATGDATAEAPLLRALDRGPAEVKRAAAAALGRVGTRDAVQPLREAERDGALRGTARQAIAEIHARLAGAAQGQLSLAEGEAGRLSIADDEAGQLSLADEKPGGARS